VTRRAPSGILLALGADKISPFALIVRIVYCTALSICTPSSHSWHTNAWISENRGNTFKVPQCGHVALVASLTGAAPPIAHSPLHAARPARIRASTRCRLSPPHRRGHREQCSRNSPDRRPLNGAQLENPVYVLDHSNGSADHVTSAYGSS